jgi:hypothetical protein
MTCRRLIWSCFLVVSIATVESAQSELTFEVASIKPNTAGDSPGSSFGYPQGRFLARNVPMRSIIAGVYGETPGFPVDRVLGGPMSRFI